MIIIKPAQHRCGYASEGIPTAMVLSRMDQLIDDVLSALDAGAVARALALLDQEITGNPMEATSRWLRAKLLLTMDGVEEAYSDARLAVRLDSQSPDAHCQLACAAWSCKRFTEAREEFAIAIRLAPSDSGFLAISVRFLAEQKDGALTALSNDRNC